MTKLKVTKEFFVDYHGTLDSLMEELTKAKLEITDPNARVFGYDGSISIEYTREETDVEYIARTSQERKLQEKQKQRDLEQLAKLKAKYPNE